MIRRKALTAGMLLLIAGVGVVLFVFRNAPGPDIGPDRVVSVDVSDLEEGSYRVVETGAGSWRYTTNFMILRFDQTFWVYLVYRLKDGRINLPYVHWWNWGHPCTHFAPTLMDGKVTRESIFLCHDAALPEDIARLQWRATGEAIGHTHDAMQSYPWVLQGGGLQIGRRGY